MTKNDIINHYKSFFDLHAKGIRLDEDDHLNIDWADDLVNPFRWKKIEKEKPLCYKSGDWDGLQSDLFLCKISDSSDIYLAIAYEGKMDGFSFFDIYENQTDCLISDKVVYWCSFFS